MSNHMIFLVQFGINKHFSKTTKYTRPMGSCTFVGLSKIYSCLFIPNCTRNHVITYTKNDGLWGREMGEQRLTTTRKTLGWLTSAKRRR